MMFKQSIFISLCVVVALVGGCSKGSGPDSGTQADIKNKSVHGDGSRGAAAVPGTPIADALKKKRLNANSVKTIGEAFDSYRHVTVKEWRETSTKSNKYYVDYICWFDISSLSAAALKDGIVKRGLEIKFVIHEDGEAFIAMATRVEVKSDGKSYSTPIDLPEIKTIVTAIYENREITF